MLGKIIFHCFYCFLVLILASPAASGQATGRPGQEGSASSVRGLVLEHETGASIADATVALAPEPFQSPGPLLRASGEDGGFLFETVPPGVYSLVVTRMGYQSFQDTLVVEPYSDLRIVVELSASPVELEPVVVVVPRSPAMAGFYQRRQLGTGTFLTRDEIEEANPLFLSDLLLSVPGATFVSRRSGGLEIRMRGGCRPSYWINGTRASDTSVSEIGIDQILSPHDVEAMEVYRGAAAVPVQFGPEACGAVVIWTRQRPPEPKGSLWKRALMAVGIAVGILLLRGT